MIQPHDLVTSGDYTNGPYSAGPSVPSNLTTTANGATYSNGNGTAQIAAPVPLFPFGSYPYHPALAHQAIHSNPQLYYTLLARHSAMAANASATSSPIQSPIPQPPMSAPATIKEVPLKQWPIASGFSTDLSSPYSYHASLSALFHSQQQQASQLVHSSSDDTLYPFHHLNSQQASQTLNNNQQTQEEPQQHLADPKNKHHHLQQRHTALQQVHLQQRREDPRLILYESQGKLQEQENQSARAVKGINYRHCYFKGSMIQLADGTIRRVEDMKTQDFILCVQSTPDAELHKSKVLAIETCDNNNSVLITFEVDKYGKPLTVESTFEHPFFVYDEGWAAYCPERCKQIYGLDVRKLTVGDNCISLSAP